MSRNFPKFPRIFRGVNTPFLCRNLIKTMFFWGGQNPGNSGNSRKFPEIALFFFSGKISGNFQPFSDFPAGTTCTRHTKKCKFRWFSGNFGKISGNFCKFREFREFREISGFSGIFPPKFNHFHTFLQVVTERFYRKTPLFVDKFFREFSGKNVQISGIFRNFPKFPGISRKFPRIFSGYTYTKR